MYKQYMVVTLVPIIYSLLLDIRLKELVLIKLRKSNAMNFTRKRMVYNDYTWHKVYAYNDSRINGEIDGTILNRKQGWEMLYFINKCAKEWGWRSNNFTAMKKLERTVRLLVPRNKRSQRKIKEWIENNYKEFWNAI